MGCESDASEHRILYPTLTRYRTRWQLQNQTDKGTISIPSGCQILKAEGEWKSVHEDPNYPGSEEFVCPTDNCNKVEMRFSPPSTAITNGVINDAIKVCRSGGMAVRGGPIAVRIIDCTILLTIIEHARGTQPRLTSSHPIPTSQNNSTVSVALALPLVAAAAIATAAF